jgi:hypothetical protein
MIRLGARGWQLYRGQDCPGGCEAVPGLRDRFWARLWLQRFKSDPAALYEIRRLAAEAGTWWPLHKATHDQAIDWMARLLADGEWHVHAPVMAEGGGGASGDSAPQEEEDLAEIVSSLPRSSDAPEPPPPPQEEALLPRDADEAAIAAAMKLASQLGIPFCEECARAALKRQREAAYA